MEVKRREHVQLPPLLSAGWDRDFRGGDCIGLPRGVNRRGDDGRGDAEHAV
jgi:hypothetical protein